ncbi:MAG: hypothetical protein QM775_15995 [Pirellulales bacterium]
MNNRVLRAATSLSVFTAVLLLTSRCGAVHYPLGPSKDDWGLKYDVQLSDAGNDQVNVVFTLIDEGRLKPVSSFTVVALREITRGTYAYDAKTPISLKTTADGKRTGQVQIRKEFLDKAVIRVLTLSVDGKRQTGGAALYNIPLNRFLKPAAPTTLAAPPASRTVK